VTRADLRQAVAQAQLDELAYGVRQDVDAHAQRTDLVGRLVDDHIGDPGGMQAQGRGQPGDAGTCDDNAHASNLLVGLPERAGCRRFHQYPPFPGRAGV
jgi:hypothetical protein